MSSNDKVTLFRAAESGSRDTVQTAGMRREAVIADPGVWVGRVYAEPHMDSGWHHHGEHDTYIYAASGHVRLEFGPGGKDVVEAGPGDIVHVPKRLIHRESNPHAEEGTIFLVRVGEGPPVINVHGPAS